jgi:hypothetical protein
LSLSSKPPLVRAGSQQENRGNINNKKSITSHEA